MRRLLAVFALFIGGVVNATNGPVIFENSNITAGTTSCFPTRTPANQVVVDLTGSTFRCDSGTSKYMYADLPACSANPPSAVACTANTLIRVCKRTDAAEIWGCAGATGFMVNMSGSGGSSSGAAGLIQRSAGSGAFGTVPGFTGDGISGDVRAKAINGVVEVSAYATAGAGTTGSPWTSPSGTGGLSEAAATCGSNGCTLRLAPGYYETTAMTTLGKGVFVEGSGPLNTIIRANAGFSGAAILRWRNPVSDNSFGGTVEQGIGGRNFNIEGNGVAAHGIQIFKAYDYVQFDNVSINNVGDAVSAMRFEPNTAYSGSRVSQTVLLHNIYAIHKNSTATAPVYYFEGLQEATLVNVKGFGSYMAAIPTCDVFYFLGCRGITMIGGAAAGTHGTGIHIASDANGSSQGLAFYGVTIEAAQTAAVKVDASASSVQQLTFMGMRKQEADTDAPGSGDDFLTGPFTFANTVKAYANIPGFSASVAATSDDVRLVLADIGDLISDAGSQTTVDAPHYTGKSFFQRSERNSLGLFPNDSSGPTIRFGHAARADYWRLFWSASSSTQFGFQLRYIDTAGTQKTAMSFDETGGITLSNSGVPALAIANTRVSPVILATPKGTTPPATCTSGDLFYDTDATVGQQLLVCNTGNAWVVQGDGGGTLLVNGAGVSNPNFATSSKITVSNPSGGTINFTPVAGSFLGTDLHPTAAGITQLQMATHTSINLSDRVIDEVGSGGFLVFNNGPTINSPLIQTANTSKCARYDASGVLSAASGDCAAGGGGTVSSVGMTMPTGEFNVTGTPVTGAGTLAVTWQAQTAGKFLAGPASGGAAVPTMRLFTALDCASAPFLGTAGTTGCIPPPSAGDISSGFFLRANGTWAAAAGLATTGTPAITQIARFGAGGTTLNGVATAVLDDSGNASFTSVTTATPANGSRLAKFVGNTSDPSAPVNTDGYLYAKSASLTDGLQLPFWRNNISGVHRILTDFGGDYGFFTCAAGTCTQDINTVTGLMIALGSDTIGDIMYYDGTNYVRLATGTTGQVLGANTGAAPSWGSPSGTEVRSMYWGAGSWSTDGTNCLAPAEVTINSGPKIYTVICNTASNGIVYGSTVMPDGWNAGTVTFELTYIQTAADTGVMNSDIDVQCRGNGEVPSSTWGTAIAIDDAAVVGSNSNDQTTSAAVTAAGTCAAGDTLYWRWTMDATATTSAQATLNIVGLKMEYTTSGSD